MSKRLAMVVLCLATTLAACSSQHVETPTAASSGGNGATLSARAYQRLDALRDDLVAFRRDLHRHPELSGQEVRTAAQIAERLERLGFQVRRNVGGHGVVAVLRGGRPGRTVAFRADMDAVQSDDPDPIDFDSENPGVRHICGHDIHATIGIALAEAFAAVRLELPGAVVLIFQPAEENVTGAQLMVGAGALENPRPDAIFAYHTAPYEVGRIAYSETTLMAARDRITATVSGPQARTIAEAIRERTLALRTIDSPESQPIGSDFLWGGAQLTAGEGGAWIVNANFSLATDAARQRLREGMQQAVTELKRQAPTTRIEIDFNARFAPGVSNDAQISRAAAASIRASLGDSALVAVRNVSPAFSEDFGHMQDLVPGAMFFLGVSNESRNWVGMPHSPNYVADEEAIAVGAKAMTRIMLDYLEAP